MAVVGYLQRPYLVDPYLFGFNDGAATGSQVQMIIGRQIHNQANMIAQGDTLANTQVNRIVNLNGIARAQVNLRVDSSASVLSQVLMRVQGKLAETHAQVLGIVSSGRTIGNQVLMRIEGVLKTARSQVNRIRSMQIRSQATMVLYNTTQLRFMRTFVSRGTPALAGNNWTASPPSASGDFGPNNLNTDIIEQVYRSQNGQQSYVTLTCDTGLAQGAFVDTLAILGHNFTRSAVVTFQGSVDPGFSPVGFSTVLAVEEQNMFYIAPDLPTNGYRYWRIIIEDGTNPDGFLQVGAVLFGNAEIFSMLEHFKNPIVQQFKHFKDSFETEGFTTVSNDRALRKQIKLAFEKLLFNNGNYQKLLELMLNARTSLKVLYIPTPEYPSRFAIFGKLVQIPEATHESISSEEEYVDISLDIDEST